MGFEPASCLAREQRFGLGVPENRLGLGIPGDLSVQSRCDPCEVASREGSMVAMDIRDRLDTIPGGFEEVSEVVDQRSVFVSGFECTAWQWVVFKVVDSLASNPSAVDEQTALGTFEQDPIVTVMSDFDFGSISEFGAEEKLRRCVVSARIGGKPVAELDGMLDHLG